MDLRDALHEGCFKPSLESNTKDDIIREMVDSLVAAERLNDPDAILASILERESSMSTGMQQGIAIPHGKTETVDRMLAAVGLKPEGVDFQSLDGEPSRIFIMTVSPPNGARPHIEFLAEIGKRLGNPEIRGRVLQAKTFNELIPALDDIHESFTA